MSTEAAHSVLLVASLVSVGVGCWMIYPPSTMIVEGVLILGLLFHARRLPPEQPKGT